MLQLFYFLSLTAACVSIIWLSYQEAVNPCCSQSCFRMDSKRWIAIAGFQFFYIYICVYAENNIFVNSILWLRSWDSCGLRASCTIVYVNVVASCSVCVMNWSWCVPVFHLSIAVNWVCMWSHCHDFLLVYDLFLLMLKIFGCENSVQHTGRHWDDFCFQT
jgi:hypothetical protein